LLQVRREDLPSLVVNEKLVCVGRFPKKDETIGWIKEAIEGKGVSR